jgi:1-acyl-sn-glycerol-3-phosphate acyltransferase
MIKEEVGRENFGREQAYIFAVNHNSHLDEFAIMPAIVMQSHRKTHFFADRKHWFEGKWFFRLLAWRFKAIPVDRGTGNADAALEKGAEYLKKGHNIIIYPEGTRGKGFKLERGKVGVAKLALWSGAPVIPVGVWGTHLLMPKGEHKPSVKRIVSIKFGKPLTFEDLIGKEPDRDALRDMTDRIMKSIADLVGAEYPH